MCMCVRVCVSVCVGPMCVRERVCWFYRSVTIFDAYKYSLKAHNVI